MLTALAILAALPLLAGGTLWALQERMIFVSDARRIEAPAGWRLERLTALHASGALTQAEFDTAKAKIIEGP